MYLLGIDIGTVSVNTVLLDEDGNVVRSDRLEYEISIPKKGYAEQDPHVWLSTVYASIRNILNTSQCSPDRIEAVGISGQMHGLVLLDKEYEVLRPAIIWTDQRTVSQVQYIQSRVGKQKLGEYISNPISTGFYAASLLWVRDNEPENYRKALVAILPKDYVRFAMTGNIGTEITDASGTGLFDVLTAQWSMPLVELLEVRADILPPFSKSTELAGHIHSAAAAACGLLPGTKVYFGASDHAMQAIGNGITRPGQLCINIGSGGQIYTPVQLSSYDRQLRSHKFCHVIPGVWNLIGATLGAGLSLKWLVTNILESSSFESTIASVAQSSPGCDGVIFLPYIAGERSPHMNAHATGMFYGLNLSTHKSDMIRAVMEGVVYSLYDCFEIFQSMGLGIEKIIVSGGGAKNRLWRQIIGDLFEQKVYSCKMGGAAFGSAILAGTACGIFSNFNEAVERCVKSDSEIIYPNETHTRIYKRNFAIFKELYQSIYTGSSIPDVAARISE